MKKIIKMIVCTSLFFQYGNASSSSAVNNISGQSRAEFTPITIVAEDISFSVFVRGLELTAPNLKFERGPWLQIKPVSQELPNVYRIQTAFDPWDNSAYAIGVMKNGKVFPYVRPRYGKDFSGKSTWVINGRGSDVVQ